MPFDKRKEKKCAFTLVAMKGIQKIVFIRIGMTFQVNVAQHDFYMK
jgi:hypothetical protein